jgi:hypothetical protein
MIYKIMKLNQALCITAICNIKEVLFAIQVITFQKIFIGK